MAYSTLIILYPHLGREMMHQVIKPIQFLALFASEHSSNIDSGVVRTGLKITFCDTLGDSSRNAVILRESSSTCFSVSSQIQMLACYKPDFLFLFLSILFRLNFTRNKYKRQQLFRNYYCMNNIPFIQLSLSVSYLPVLLHHKYI